MKITLPPQLKSKSLLGFIEEAGQCSSDESLLIDFSALRKITPIGLTMLAALKERHGVEFEGLRKCPILGYLQRMDFLKACGLENLKENFARREAKGRFVPVEPISVDVQGMGTRISECLAPGGEDFGHEMADLYDFCWYVFTELGNNVRQHSGGNGFAAAQMTQIDGMIRIAIADNGKGIRRSLREVNFVDTKGISHADAIRKALQPKVSSKGQPTNEGVGLTFVKELIQQTGAWLLIVSGNGQAVVDEGGKTHFTDLSGSGYEGTLIGMVFPRKKVIDFDHLLSNAKKSVSLLREESNSGNFEP